MDSVLVRQKETDIGAKGLRNNPCLNCPEHCCSQHLINVCGYDIWAIANELYLRPTDFLAFAQLGTVAPYNFKLDSSEKAYCLTLNMKQLPDGSHRCIFALDLPHHQVRCGIYSFRPIGCRAYPLVFEEENVIVKPWALCPDGAWDLTQIDLGFWQEELRRHDMEFSIYTFVIRVWNKEMVKQPRLENLDFRPFLNFLMDVYCRLEVARKEVPTEAWPGIWQQWHRFTVDGLNPLLLYVRQTADVTNFDWWLQNIQKAVSEASQNIYFEGTGRI